MKVPLVLIYLPRTNTISIQTEVEVKGLRIVLPEKLKQKASEEEEGVDSFNVNSFNVIDGSLSRLIRQYSLQEVTLKGVSQAFSWT